ncbi:MAG TPA: CCC motif membrane protein [Bacteroidales bacterium]|nr:CCC motif membrane protein [Bacteroidales bacterium]HRZ48124.1 CCC motif membrane protein [Bacteroidales bacterium]
MNSEETRFGSEQEPVRQTPVDQYAVGGFQETLPNSTGILVMGILSIVTCFCYGIPGMVLAIIALVLAGKANTLVNAQPERYTISSVKNFKAGRVCAIIGLVLSILYLIFVIIYIAMLGTLVMNPEAINEMFNL